MQKDISEKQLIKHNDVFADIYNALVFEGKEVLKEEMLQALPTESVSRRLDGRLQEGRRDIRKLDCSKGQYHLIIGLENQTGYDNTMPERVMGYDFAAYEEQIREIQAENKRQKKPAYQKRIHDDQKLAPSITVVLYLGDGKWKGPKDLHDMLQFPEEMEESIRPYVANYPLHVISVSCLSDKERSRLKSDFRLVADYLNSQNKKEAFEYLRRENTHTICHPEELFEMLAAVSGDNRYYDIVGALEQEEHNREGMTMCELWDYVENTGIQKGIKQGETRLNELILFLLRENRYDDLQRCTKDEEYRWQLMEKYGIL